MRRTAIALLVLAAGCGSSAESLPAACSDTVAIQGALTDVPGAVTLDGKPLSRCFTRAGDAGEVQVAGAAFIEAAEQLAEAARSEPEGDAALQLGYLVGAARRGSTRSEGLHYEVVRRIEQAAAPAKAGSGFRRGERAGRASG